MFCFLMNGIPSFKHLQGLEFHSVSGLFRIKSRDIKWIEFDRTWAFVTLNFDFSYSHIHPKNKRTTTRLFCCLKCFVFLFFCQSRTFLALPLHYFRLISKQHKVKEKEGERIEKKSWFTPVWKVKRVQKIDTPPWSMSKISKIPSPWSSCFNSLFMMKYY